MFARWYRRRGPRYPLAAVSAALRLQHPVFVVTVALLALYVPLSLVEFVELALAAVAGQALYNFFTLRRMRRQLAPVVQWIGGERSPGGTPRASGEAGPGAHPPAPLWGLGGVPAVGVGVWRLVSAWG